MISIGQAAANLNLSSRQVREALQGSAALVERKVNDPEPLIEVDETHQDYIDLANDVNRKATLGIAKDANASN